MTTEANAPEAEYLRGYADGWHDGYATIDDKPADDTEKDTEEQEAAMQDDDVERVALAIAKADPMLAALLTKDDFDDPARTTNLNAANKRNASGSRPMKREAPIDPNEECVKCGDIPPYELPDSGLCDQCAEDEEPTDER